MSIEKLTFDVMANKAAADYYALIPGGALPLQLADDYALAKLQDNAAECLALELHLRQAAQLRFERADVREALRRMEYYKSHRKFGTGGSQDMKKIARNIELDYAYKNYHTENADEFGEVRAIFYPADGLKIKCIARPGAIAWVVAKFRRGLAKRRLTA